MAKLLLIGDCHIQPKTIIDLTFAFEQIYKIIQEHEIQHIVLCGDELDLHSTVKESSFNFLIEILEKILSFNSTKVYLLVGNHDFKNNNVFCSNDHFLNPFKKWKNVQVIDVPTIININNNKIACFPFIPEGRFHEARIKYLGEDINYNLCLGHQGFTGATLDNGMAFTGTDKWLKKYPMMITGHFHSPHQPQENLIYVGSLIPLKHGEDDPKRILIVTLNSDKALEIGEIEMESGGKYVTILIDIQDPPNKIEKSEKLRYILSGGTMAELTAFHSSHRKKLGTKVKFNPEEKDVSLPARENIDVLKEFRKVAGNSFDDYFSDRDIDNIGIKLKTPKGKLTLSIKHFLIFDDYEVDIDKGLTVIEGDNGTGKSTLLRCIFWLLYGGNVLDKQKTEVSLSNENKWQIMRASHPKRLITKIKEKSYNDDVAQEVINRTFGKKDFFETCFFLNQGSRCSFFTSTDREKKEMLNLFFEDLSDLQPVGDRLLNEETIIKKESHKAIIAFDDFCETVSDLDLKTEPLKPSMDDVEVLAEPVYSEPILPTYDDIRNLDSPIIEVLDLSHIKEIELPEPIFEPLHKLNLDDLPEIEVLKLPKLRKPNPPDQDIQKKIDKCNEELEELKESEIKLRIFEGKIHEQQKIREHLAELEKNIPREDTVKHAKKKLALVTSINDNPEDPVEITEDFIEKNDIVSKKWKLSQKYEKTYGKIPTRERLSEIDISMKWSDSHETTCPKCLEKLLVHTNRDKSVVLELIPETFIKEKFEDLEVERELLLKANFIIEPPEFTSDQLRLQQQKFNDQKKLSLFSDIDHEKILKEYNELAVLRQTERNRINKIQTPQLSKKNIEERSRICHEKLEECQKDKLLLSDYDNLLNFYEEQRKDQENIRKEHQKKIEERISERKERMENYQKQKENYENEKTRVLEEYQRKKAELKLMWERERDNLTKDYEARRERILNEHKKESEFRLREKTRRQMEYEKSVSDVLQQKKKFEEEQKRREIERKRSITVWQKESERHLKLKDKEEKLLQEKNKSIKLLTEIQNKLNIYKQIHGQILERKLSLWNEYFTEILKHFFENSSCKISPFRENKTGNIEKITIEVEIKGVKYTDLSKLSWGTYNLVSLSFQLAMIILVPNRFKIVLLDEPLSNLDEKRKEKASDILQEYLDDSFVFVANHDHGIFGDCPLIEFET